MFETGTLGFRPLRVALAAACAVSCLSIALLIGFSVYRDRQRVMGPVIRSSSQISRILGEHVFNIFRTAETVFSRVEKQQAEKGLPTSPVELSSFLQDHHPEIRGLDFVFVLDAKGGLLAASDPHLMPGTKFELRDVWDNLDRRTASGMIVGNLDHTLGPQRVIVPIIKPIRDSTGRIVALMGAAMDVAYFQRFFQDLQGWGPNGFSLIAETGPIVLRYPYLEDIMGQNYRSQSTLYEKARTEGVGWIFERSPYDGVIKLLYFRTVSPYPMFVLVNRSKSDIFASWRTTTLIRIPAATAAIFLLIWLTSFLLRQIRRLETDETSRGFFERHSQESQRMEGLGRFAGDVAHDFNNILTILFGHMEALKTLLPNEPETNRLRGELFQSAKQGQDLVQRILAVTRRPEQEQDETEVSEVIGEFSNLVKAGLPAGIRLNVRVQPGLYIQGTSGSFSQVLMSLMTNSLEAMRIGGGLLEISADRAYPTKSSEMASDFVRIAVQDSGAGIAEEDQKKLFQPFFTTKGGDSLGLGLSVSRRIVEAAGGRIRISSELGQGTLAEVFWPTPKAAKDVAPTQNLPTRGLGGERGSVLFVDDEETLVELARDSFQSNGIPAACFSNPEAACEEFCRHSAKYSLIVTDINMQPIDGFELIRRIQQVKSELPIVFSTAHPEVQEQVRQHTAFLSGHGVLLKKPYQLPELMDVVKSCLELQQANKSGIKKS